MIPNGPRALSMCMVEHWPYLVTDHPCDTAPVGSAVYQPGDDMLNGYLAVTVDMLYGVAGVAA